MIQNVRHTLETKPRLDQESSVKHGMLTHHIQFPMLSRALCQETSAETQMGRVIYGATPPTSSPNGNSAIQLALLRSIVKCEESCTACNVLTDSKCTPVAEPAPSDGLHIASSSAAFAPLAFNNVSDYRMKANAPDNTYLCGVKLGSFDWTANGVS